MFELNKIYCMDCLEGMKQLEDNSVNLTVTSPPYDNLRDYKGYSFNFEGIAKELYRVTKKGGVIVWIVGDQTINGSETGTSFKQALFFKEVGFNLHDTMIYQKECVFPDSNRYLGTFEYMFVFSKGKPKTVNFIIDKKNKSKAKYTRSSYRQQDGSLKWKKPKEIKEYGRRGNIWYYSTGFQKTTKEKFAFEHPAMFPEALAKDHILSWSNKDDIVLDPFVGSGTTCKMAKQTNRNFIGFEINPDYVKIANKRLEQANLREVLRTSGVQEE